MTRGSILEYIKAIQGRYVKAKKSDKGKILGEFVNNTGYHRKSAIRIQGSSSRTKKVNKRGRPKKYQSMVAYELKYLWEITDHLCNKRLHPFIPEFVDIVKRCGDHAINAEAEAQLRELSTATIDRLLFKSSLEKLWKLEESTARNKPYRIHKI